MSRPARTLLLLILTATAIRAAVAAAFPLINDEALYWLYSRRLDWSYLHHPPMIAYLIALTTLAGDAALWVRLPSLLLGAATSYALFILGRDLFDEQAGLRAAALFQVTPLLFAPALLAIPDAPFALAWVVALHLAWQALHGRPGRWYGVGLAMGVGLLSKLYMAMLGAGLLLYIVFRARPALRRREPYLAGLLALGFLFPVIYWNVQHDWAAFGFALKGRAFIDPFGGPKGLRGLLLLLQLYLPFVGLLFPAFLWGAWQVARRRADPRYAFLGWAGLPLTLFTLVAAARGLAHGHWVGPVHLCLALVLGSLWRRGVDGLTLANGALIVVAFAFALIPALPLPGASEFYGWREAAARAQEEARGVGAGMVMANRWEIGAQVAYYTRDTIPVVVMENASGSDPVWSPLQRHRGQTAVAVTDARWDMGPAVCFASAEESRFAVEFRGRVVRRFRLFRLSGFLVPCPG